MASLKERGRVKRRVCGFLSGFPDGYGACRAGPRASPGAWGALFPGCCRSRVSGPVRVKDRAGSRPAEPAPQASLTRRAAIR